MTGLAGAKVAFRADASLQIGTGHVMRCLTLAAALRARGAECQFICRAHAGNLIEHIGRQGYKVSSLPIGAGAFQVTSGAPAHAAWLGCEAPLDAAQTVTALSGCRPDWLVVDHYALDRAWQAVLAEHAARLLVIDDLADREHRCDLLLDQNLGRRAADYARRVPAGCRVLVGPRYALLRPDFAALREYSLSRRARPVLASVLLTMGGIDRDNATAAVLKTLRDCDLPGQCRIRLVMGATAPWLAQVRELAAQMPWHTEVCVAVENMAQLMADSDLAIGAGGTTSWERCCLGLPTLMLVLADNQQQGADALVSCGAAMMLGELSVLERTLPDAMRRLLHGETLARAAAAAGQVTDGQGVQRVTAEMGAFDD